MQTAILTRKESSPQGTFGEFQIGDKKWYSLELPWKDNLPEESCIPLGSYQVKTINSPKHGNPTYEVQNVPGRGEIEIHSANWAGDAKLGYKCQLLGCIALGKNVAILEGQPAITESKKAIKEFMEYLAGEEFKLTIIGQTT